MARVLVVGPGFLGRALLERLATEGHAVRALHRSPIPPGAPDVEWLQGDLRDGAAVARAVAGVDTVVHLASTTVPATSNTSPQDDVRANLLPSIGLMEAAAEAGARRVVFASSGGTVYGVTPRTPIVESAPTDPISSYGAVKLATEKYLDIFRRERSLDPVVLRFANVYGPGHRLTRPQGAVGWFLAQALAGKPVTLWGDGSAVRDYVYLDDAVAALAAAVSLPRDTGPAAAGERVYNIGTGVGTSVEGLLQAIEAVLGRPVQRVHHPPRAFDVPYNVLDPGRAARGLGWRASVALPDGLRRTVAALQASPPAASKATAALAAPAKTPDESA